MAEQAEVEIEIKNMYECGACRDEFVKLEHALKCCPITKVVRYMCPKCDEPCEDVDDARDCCE